MKIAYCIGALNLGGVGTVAHNLSQFFLKRGDDFHIVSTHHKGNFYDTAVNLNWPVKDISSEEISLKKRMRTTYEFLLNYDVVINNHSDEVLFILPALPQSIIKISVQHNTTTSSSKRLSFNAEYLHYSAGVSPAVTSVMKRYHKSIDKVKVLPNGVSKVTNKVYRTVVSDPLRLLYVGRLDNHQKNIFILPEILKSLLDKNINATLTIAGSGEDEEQLKTKFSELAMMGQCHFAGRITSKVLAEFFKSHDFLINPSNWEGLPMVVLEAMSAGVIPILSNIEPHKYALGSTLSTELLPNDNNTNSYADIIMKLYNNSQNSKTISKKLVKQWESIFSIESFGENYLNLIMQANTADILVSPIPFNKIKLPLKDRHKVLSIYNFAQNFLRRTK